MFDREFPPPVALIPDAKPDWKLDPGFAIGEAADDEDGTEGAEGIDDAAEVGIDDADDPMMLLDGGLNAEPSPDIPEPPPPPPLPPPCPPPAAPLIACGNWLSIVGGGVCWPVPVVDPTGSVCACSLGLPLAALAGGSVFF